MRGFTLLILAVWNRTSILLWTHRPPNMAASGKKNNFLNINVFHQTAWFGLSNDRSMMLIVGLILRSSTLQSHNLHILFKMGPPLRMWGPMHSVCSAYQEGLKKKPCLSYCLTIGITQWNNRNIMQPVTLSYAFLIRLPWIFVLLLVITFFSLFFLSFEISHCCQGIIN